MVSSSIRPMRWQSHVTKTADPSPKAISSGWLKDRCPDHKNHSPSIEKKTNAAARVRKLSAMASATCPNVVSAGDRTEVRAARACAIQGYAEKRIQRRSRGHPSPSVQGVPVILIENFARWRTCTP